MPVPLRLLPLALLVLAACPSPGEDSPDAGAQEIPDLCDTAEEALTSSECELVLGETLERYISVPGDRDWYSVRMPATLGPRSLLRVQAGYAVQSTAVNLAVSLLREDGKQAVADRQVDAHGQGAPKPIEIIIPFSEPGARLLLLLGDEPAIPSRPAFDTRAPYFLKVEVLENPDGNEPNDTTPTPLALADQEGVLVGSATGYLATKGDVDQFSFEVARGKIAYVRLTAPSLSPEPPPPYRLSYELLRPDGSAEDEERALNNILPVDLASARRVLAAGTWRVRVRAYQSATSSEVPPGDLRQQYTLEVRVLDEADPNEGSTDNDAMLRARVLSLAGSPGGAPLTFTGRLGSVPDKDWYAVDLPAASVPTALHYRLVPLETGGRFPPLPGLVVDRLVRVFTEVGGATATDCATREDVCPKGYGQNTVARDLVNAWCAHSPPLCVHSSREESPYHARLRNFEGALPVPPHAATLRYYFLVQDDGTNWADDKDYRLEVRWLADDDDSSRYSAGAEQPVAKALAEGSSFPAPPAGAAYEVSGTLSHGQGRLVGFQPQSGKGVRGPMDYDAVPTDVDTYVLQLPSGLTEPVDRTWTLQWEVGHLPDGGLPHGLALGLTFCDGDNLDGGVCTPVSTGSRGAPLTLAYRGDSLRAWHSPSNALDGLQPLYSLERGATSTTVTVLPYACSCLEPRFIRGGSVSVDVSAVDRTDYGVVPYTLRTAYTGYPKTYAVDGGTASCPAPVASVDADGGTVYEPGCFFTRQP